jgi:uncharacterized protein (DUF1015 family)
MADIKPFCAVRYSSEKFNEKLVAPPYDIISESQRLAMTATEYHMINIDKPGKDDDPERYKKAEERFESWKAAGVMTRDGQPAFYVYAQRFKHPEDGQLYERTGFFCLVKLEEQYEKSIYPHERTLSAPKADRLKLMQATEANLSPVFGLYDDPDETALSIFERIKQEKPLYETYRDNDGTEHLLWAVADEDDINQLTMVLKNKNIIIADGHHRYATALEYCKEMRKKETEEGGERPYEYVLMDLINFQDKGLVILPTHRLLDLPIDRKRLISDVKRFFNMTEKKSIDIEAALLRKSAEEKKLGLYCGQDFPSYLLELKGNACLDGVVPESSSQDWRTLEVNLLYYVVLKHILQINDTDFETKILYTHAFNETFEMIDEGKACCAFLLPPCSKEDLERVTQAREVMPQKSTYFFPKIFSGFVIYDHAKACCL